MLDEQLLHVQILTQLSLQAYNIDRYESIHLHPQRNLLKRLYRNTVTIDLHVHILLMTNDYALLYH